MQTEGIVQFLIAGMGAAVSVIGGFFALIRYFVKASEKSQTQFLDHLKMKNGHTERIANEFSQTMAQYGGSLENLKDATLRNIQVIERVERVLDRK